MNRPGKLFALLLWLGAPEAALSQATTNAALVDYAAADQVIDEFRLDAHIPGIVYGIVENGRLVHVQAFGIQDTTFGMDGTAPLALL